MFLANASVRRPVAMCCLIIGLVIMGVNTYLKMQVEYLPKVDAPYCTILTIYPGATPEEIETDIAKRIEDAVVSVDGIKHIKSVCMENANLILLEFHLNVDIDVAANDVREQVNMIVNELPAGAEEPKVLKYDINAKPIVDLALSGDVPMDALFDYADNELRDLFSVIPGVADLQLIGGSEREVHVLLDREALGARGLTSMAVFEAIQRGVRTIPSGRVRAAGTEYAVTFDADFSNPEAIGMLEVAGRDGMRCYIKDIGRVVMTTKEQRQIAEIDGHPCVGIRVVKKSEANAVEVVNRVRDTVAELNRRLPGGMKLTWVTDDGTFIQATSDSTTISIFQGVLLTALVLFIFLHNIRSTIIVAITMPLTIVISLSFMQFLGYTLNMSTLIAIGLSVGILVTNSIVVLENIIKRFDSDPNPWRAARQGANEVAVAVLASAGTNLVVLFPIAAMKSQIGMFFAPFAMTMVIVTVVSLFISFSLTPILAAVLLKSRKNRNPKGLSARAEDLWNKGFDTLSGAYLRFLAFFSRHKLPALAVLALTALIFFHALSMAPRIGFDFVPDADRGEVYIKLEYPTHYNLHVTQERVREVHQTLGDMPGLRHSFTTIGKVQGMMGQASEGVYLAQILLKFIDKMERPESIHDIVHNIRQRLRNYPDCIVTVTIPSGVGGMEMPLQLEISGDDYATLDRLIEQTKDIAKGVPGLADMDTTVRMGKPELRVRPDRAILADMSFPAVGMGMALRANLEGLIAGTYKELGRNYDIRVKMDEVDGKDQVKEFLLPGGPGHPIVLSNVASIEEGLAPVQIMRHDKQRVVRFFSELEGGKPLGTAVQELSKLVDASLSLPPGYSYRYVGLYEVMEEANADFLEAGILAIILTYLVLAAILESWLRPLIILITIPLALVGVMWALALTGESISMFVLLGFVMLIGIVVNNAILIMDLVSERLKAGDSRRQAMLYAAAERFRPVLMITLAAILGMLPLALGRGLGSEVRTSIGIASIGGIAVSAALTLIVLPLLFNFFTRAAKKGGSKTPGGAPKQDSAPTAAPEGTATTPPPGPDAPARNPEPPTTPPPPES